jgi:hypothetical protein
MTLFEVVEPLGKRRVRAHLKLVNFN